MTPMLPGRKMLPGSIPTNDSSGVINPGQLGPINRAPLSLA